MDDPSGELRRQRELIAAHLRWLDEQIARTSGATLPPAGAAPTAPVLPIPPPPPLATAAMAVPHPAGPEIALPDIDPGSIRNEVRRGCFIYIAIISVLLAASVAVAVWIARSW